MQLAMRQMRAHFTDPRVIGALLVVALLIGFIGPFGTFDVLDTGPRFAYWGAIVLATYAVGYAVGALTFERVHRAIRNRIAGTVVLGLLQGPPIALAVHLVNVVSFGASVVQLPMLVLYCTVVSIAVLAEIARFYRPQPAAPAAPAPAPILARLPLPQRGRLRALIATDHYVEVLTDKGSGLLLMRLADAIGETTGVAGVQIHRSHWVALDAVDKLVRTDGKPFVELSGGRRLPISRGYLAAARNAGLAT
jgi:hypothetical protein